MGFRNIIGLSVLSTFTYAIAENKSYVCLNETCPSGSISSNLFVDHNVFALSANINTKFADWVAYKVEAKNLDGGSHKRKWKKDPNIPDGSTLSPSDYKNAHAQLGYDRGHQAPLAAFSNTDDWKATNYLSNITPQKSELNQGAWNNLENKVRDLARQLKSVYVITGTLYESSYPSLPMAQLTHKVPSSYWKTIFIKNESGIKMASFIMPQSAQRKDSYCDYKSSLTEVETRSKLSLLPKRLSVLKQGGLLAQLGC
ncbi:DNA/RNA non-specific endonuclease [Cysteiniphilum marinum]|uniref:DNA/RNA non-specific endonuclease n=1 Tax=Cysteiniphilum marinum TaxID=2774191 RepID=UPI0019399C17|nr:DNA/RNA non-specific endonuclease [Cysteiniphilum marinum]